MRSAGPTAALVCVLALGAWWPGPAGGQDRGQDGAQRQADPDVPRILERLEEAAQAAGWEGEEVPRYRVLRHGAARVVTDVPEGAEPLFDRWFPVLLDECVGRVFHLLVHRREAEWRDPERPFTALVWARGGTLRALEAAGLGEILAAAAPVGMLRPPLPHDGYLLETLEGGVDAALFRARRQFLRMVLRQCLRLRPLSPGRESWLQEGLAGLLAQFPPREGLRGAPPWSQRAARLAAAAGEDGFSLEELLEGFEEHLADHARAGLARAAAEGLVRFLLQREGGKRAHELHRYVRLRQRQDPKKGDFARAFVVEDGAAFQREWLAFLRREAEQGPSASDGGPHSGG